MTVHSLESLVQAVLASSKSNDWRRAVNEWVVVDLEEEPAGTGVCVCGQTNLVKLFTIKNELNGAVLYPIGSVCVNKFGREDLDRQVSVFSDLHALRKALVEGQDVALTSEFFSRALLEYLLDSGAFTPDQWNFSDGERDYDFLAKMFNKRNKDTISTRQQQKIYMLLRNKVFPFVLTQ
ncbi:MAG: hypothetical protein JWP19_2196 [Rhodoglobus sp.]|nr:hypothetical protein [Rhodoglobus sp.]